MKRIELKKYYVLPEALGRGPEEWEAIPKLAKVIPFGYRQDPSNPGWLLPIPLELEALKKAKKYLRQYSYRRVANWLTTTTGRPLTHSGLKSRIDIENKRKRAADIARKIAKEYAKALEELDKLENKRLDASKGTQDTSSCQTA